MFHVVQHLQLLNAETQEDKGLDFVTNRELVMKLARSDIWT